MSVTARRALIAVLLLALCLAAALYIQQHWAVWLHTSVSLQRRLHQAMTLLLQEVGNDRPRAGLMLAAFSFLYGVLHALGPGHGKIVIMTYLATHPSRLRASMAMTVAASLLQGLVAITLVSIVLGVLQLSSRFLHVSSFWLEKGSYALVVLLGVALCLRAAKRALALSRSRRQAGGMRIRALRPLEEAHIHDEHCGCGHQHVPSAQQAAQAVSWRTWLAVVVAMGIRPCSGAILVLLFAKVIGVYAWGVAAALAMAAGTALTISSIALLVHAARRIAERLALRGQKGQPGYWPLMIMLAGGVVLIVAGVLLYQGALPESGGIRPFGRG